MRQIDYKQTSKYWNRSLKQQNIGRYSSNYIISSEFEDVAYYRFRKELSFLNKFGRFGGSYLDLGCGSGNYIYEWNNKFNHLIGIDFSGPLIKVAKRKCKSLNNVELIQDNVLNFKNHIKTCEKFKLIFIGGCLMFLNDKDLQILLNGLFEILEDDGVLIFREPTATIKRIYEKNEKYTCIRRTIGEYKKSVLLNKSECEINHYPNYSANYTYIIVQYLRLFPFLKNKIQIFNILLVELLFLHIPLLLIMLIKRNLVLYHFFVTNK